MPDAAGKINLSVSVTKPSPYTFDLGLLLATDPNPLILESNLEDDLTSAARDGAQALLNQLLSTCPINSTPAGVLLSLPPTTTPLPREKPLPPPKTETTWEKFARKKGIKAKTAAQRQKMQYDEATGEWVPKWGYKGANKSGDDEWIVEIDEQKERERKDGTQQRNDSRNERKERMKREERKQRSNDRKGRSGKASGLN